MITKFITKGNNGANENQITLFEKKYNLLLPIDFRNFLLKTNGCDIRALYYNFYEKDNETQGYVSSINSLEAIEIELQQLSSLETSMSEIEGKEISYSLNKMLPIGFATEPDGAYLFIGFGAEEYGRIFVIDINNTCMENRIRVTPIANSFSQFLSFSNLNLDNYLGEHQWGFNLPFSRENPSNLITKYDFQRLEEKLLIKIPYEYTIPILENYTKLLGVFYFEFNLQRIYLGQAYSYSDFNNHILTQQMRSLDIFPIIECDNGNIICIGIGNDNLNLIQLYDTTIQAIVMTWFGIGAFTSSIERE